MTRHTFLLMVAVSLLALSSALAACGDDGPGAAASTSTTSAPTDASYVEAVCSAADRMYTSYQRNLSSGRDSIVGMDPTDAYIKMAREPYTLLVDELARVVPPTALQGGHEQMLAQARDLRDAMDHADRVRVLSLTNTPDTGKWKQVLTVPADMKSALQASAAKANACQALVAHGGGDLFR